MAETDTKGAITPEKHLPEALEKNKWKKGQSGNPAGRPEGSVSIVEGIKKKLLEIEPENKKTYLDLFLSRYFRKAIKDGDVNLMKDFINRVDGMPKQRTDITSGDKPIPILGNVYNNNSDKETNETKEED